MFELSLNVSRGVFILGEKTQRLGRVENCRGATWLGEGHFRLPGKFSQSQLVSGV